jgi:hypothetical protein
VTVRLDAVARVTPARPLVRHLVADEGERRAIAKALDLVRLDRLEAHLDIAPWFDGVRIDGRWRADITQTCGVSLDDFETALAGAFTVRAVPEGSLYAEPDLDEIEIDLDAEDPPDVLEADTVDLAAYVVEHLALELDPFPRKPGVVFEPPAAEPESSPFDVLRRLKTDGSEG